MQDLSPEIEKQVIKIQVDQSLTSIWDALDLTKEERKEKKKNLRKLLFDAYSDYVTKEYFELEQIKRELIKTKKLFQQTKDKYGAFTVIIPNDCEKLPVREQIKRIQKLTEDLETQYQSQKETCKARLQILNSLYDDLGVPVRSRGEFSEDDDTDYSRSKIRRTNQKIDQLQSEKDRRVELNSTLSNHINDQAKLTEEPIEPEVEDISMNLTVTKNAITTLEETSSSLITLKNNRSDTIRIYIRRIKELYSLLAVDEQNWIKFSTLPTASNISLLEQEIEFLESQKEHRIPQIIAIDKEEINRLCGILKIPKFRRPEYVGDDMIEELQFYRNALSQLENQINSSQVNSSPIGKTSFNESSMLSSIRDLPKNVSLNSNQTNSYSKYTSPYKLMTNTSIANTSLDSTKVTGSPSGITSRISPIKYNSKEFNSPAVKTRPKYDLTSPLFGSKTYTIDDNDEYDAIIRNRRSPSVADSLSPKERKEIYLRSRMPFYV
ncbi:hypothetical protein TRFO_33104 [Tritrichomonas foetus]|uniref:Uncharacterized protein n=1 Tax=Tritrichomonas foetus TaxID=1144522 RepID=A0A1J4JM94_9EUKA|nr:hypothetical protein TRFO_33104 [Tritrichomonas foetus]|eukprot:OHT00233.1 hypothetical protein TRFO_33104 [Tritrichomonas foetus]